MKRTLAFAMLLMLSAVAFAHPGGTDSNGGHYDRSTGEYHYHHGYSAHQHTNGVCPYDYDDRTGQNSGSNARTTSYSTSSYDWYDEYEKEMNARQNAVRELNALKNEYKRFKPRIYLFAGCIGLGAGIVVVLIQRASYNRKLEEAEEKASRRKEEEVEQLRRALAADYATSLRNAEQQAKAALTQMRISLADEWSKRVNAAETRATKAEYALEQERVSFAQDQERRKQNSAMFMKMAQAAVNEDHRTAYLSMVVQNTEVPSLDEGLVYVPRDLNSKVYHRDYVGCGVSSMVLASKRHVEAYGLTQCRNCAHAAQPSGDITVRAAPSGTKVYHSVGTGICYGYTLKELPLSKALARGLRPCSKCSPPSENPKVYY